MFLFKLYSTQNIKAFIMSEFRGITYNITTSLHMCMGESFFEYSWIQDSDLLSFALRQYDRLNLILLLFCRFTACFRFGFWKFRILEILGFHPCMCAIWSLQDQFHQIMFRDCCFVAPTLSQTTWLRHAFFHMFVWWNVRDK